MTVPLTRTDRQNIEGCCDKPYDCKWGGIGGCGYEGRKNELITEWKKFPEQVNCDSEIVKLYEISSDEIVQ